MVDRRSLALVVALLTVLLGGCRSATTRQIDALASPGRSSAQANGDAEECARWERIGKSEEGEFRRPPGDYTPGRDGFSVAPADYLSSGEMAKLADLEPRVGPKWLPAQLKSRRARVVVSSQTPGAERVGDWLLYTIEWPRSAGGSAESAITLMVYERHGIPVTTLPPAGGPRRTKAELDEARDRAPRATSAPPNGRVMVRGGRGELGQMVSEHDSLSWTYDERYLVSIVSQNFDYRINCEELLATARSVEPF